MNENPASPAASGSGIDVFTSLFNKIDVEKILPFGNGLAFLALLLAAILIAISMVRGKTDDATSLLIRRFLSVAMFFVVTTGAIDILRTFFPAADLNQSVSLRIAPVTISEIEEKFPLLVGYNGEERDIFDAPYETTLSGSKNFISVNAFAIANRLATRSRLISELTQSVEATARTSASPSGLQTDPTEAGIDPGGG